MANPEAAGPVISKFNLAGHASAGFTVEWHLADFCDNIRDRRAELQDLLQSKVTLVRRCRAQPHEYVILKVDCMHLPYMQKNLWLRCERRPIPTPLSSLPFQDHRSQDTVMISFEEAKLSINQPIGFMETRGLLLKNVVDLWRIIEDNAPLYRLFSLNCRWFSSVIWENLTQFFPGDRPAISDGSLLNRVMKAVGRDTAQKTKAVTRLFLDTLEAREKLAPREHTFYSIPRMSSTDPINGESKQWRLHLRDVLDSNDTTQMYIFLVAYRAFATGTEVLDEVKAYSRPDDPSYSRAWIMAQHWSKDELKDRNVGTSVIEWIVRDRSHFPRQADQDKSSVFSSTSSGFPRPWKGQRTSTTRGLSGKEQKRIVEKLLSRNETTMKSLVEVLRRRESEMRRRLTSRHIMEWFEWVYSPHVKYWSHPLEFKLFSTGDEVYYWVLDTLLCEGFEKRKNWYRCFLKLAELCQDDGNYASMSSIMRALNTQHVRCLTHTQKACKDAEANFKVLYEESADHIRESEKDLRGGNHLYPLDALRAKLQDLFEAASEDADGKVSWLACQQLFEMLVDVAKLASDPPLPEPTEVSEFLSLLVDQGLQKQETIAERAQRLGAIDKDQYTAFFRSTTF